MEQKWTEEQDGKNKEYKKPDRYSQGSTPWLAIGLLTQRKLFFMIRKDLKLIRSIRWK